MRITSRVEGDQRHYDMVLSREDFAHMSAGFPDVDSLYGRCGGTEFYLYEGTQMPDRFTPSPLGGYQAHIGISAPQLPLGFNTDDLDRLSDEFDQRLGDAIAALEPLPMLVDYGGVLGEKTLGYVHLSLESRV